MLGGGLVGNEKWWGVELRHRNNLRPSSSKSWMGRGRGWCIVSEHEPEQLHAKILSIWICMKRRPRQRDEQVLEDGV